MFHVKQSADPPNFGLFHVEHSVAKTYARVPVFHVKQSVGTQRLERVFHVEHSKPIPRQTGCLPSNAPRGAGSGGPTFHVKQSLGKLGQRLRSVPRGTLQTAPRATGRYLNGPPVKTHSGTVVIPAKKSWGTRREAGQSVSRGTLRPSRRRTEEPTCTVRGR
jgi:hypothetical protein